MDPLNILTVCTGNICRSPLAEYHLKDTLDPHNFTISSAGTHAVQNGRVSDPQIAIARRLGLTNIVHHKATQLTRRHIAQADLILTATLGHRRSTVQILPSASVKTFTIREFAHLCSHVREQDITELITNRLPLAKVAATAVHQLRGHVDPPDSSNDYNISDPFGADEEAYERSADQLLNALYIVESYLTKVASVVQQSTVQQSTPLNTAFPTEGNPHPSGKHSYDPLNPEQLRMREQVSRRMREQLSQGKLPMRRRHAK
ncbi:MAG: hypothetical protein U0P48_03455 [Ancrocorticia sp.]|mgnify:FL=1